MPRVLLLSNGHGEDRVGAQLAQEWLEQDPNIQLSAYPIVDEGNAYESLGIPILGGRKKMPSGGFLIQDVRLVWRDLRAGYLHMTFRQWRELARLEFDAILIVGDIYALLLSRLVKAKQRFYMQPLVSIHLKPQNIIWNRFFMEHISGLERYMIRHWVDHMYVRDAPTAKYLHSRQIAKVSALGNPMMDAVAGTSMPEHEGKMVIALLPGTRAHAQTSLILMLESLKHLDNITGLVAWAGGELPNAVGDWQLIPCEHNDGLMMRLEYRHNNILIYQNRFADILHTAQLALGTAGTANEQAAGLGIPVVSFPLPPLYNKTYLNNQKRLLAKALNITDASPNLIAGEIQTLLNDSKRYSQAVQDGLERMGSAGGTSAIIQDIRRRF